MPEPVPPPPADEPAALHRRLLEGDPTAPRDLADVFVPRLTRWLEARHPGAAPDFRVEAAEDAVLSLIKNPASYDPQQLPLERYLRMAAQGDLLNRLARERKHHRGRKSWQSVELADGGGKYLGRDDDPSLPLHVAEARADLLARLAPEVLKGLSVPERRVLELLLAGERRTEVFAEAYEIDHLPPEEQEREVKRVKDKLRARLRRHGGQWP